MIFVFGSNLIGVHGAGAALYAVRFHGAISGQGIGMQGSSYAIPTKDERFRSLHSTEIEGYVEDFIQFAEDNPKLDFQVTKIGCGLAGFQDKQIAPLFDRAPKNCYFDEAWEPYFMSNHPYWGSF